MDNKWFLRGRIIFFALLAAFLFYTAFDHSKKISESDPDRYYHFAVSKMTSEQGRLKTLPQVDDLGWGKQWPEKEFLFHSLTGLAHRMGGEDLVAKVPLFLGCLSILFLFAFALSEIGPELAFFSVLTGCLLVPNFLFRLMLLRPHTLAILCFILLAIGLFRRKSWLSALACFAFALSYHAVYVPAAFVLLDIALDFKNWRHRIQQWLLAMGGLVVGVFINPYFPLNVQMGLRHLKIAMGRSGVDEHWLGMELIPLRSDTFIYAYLFPLAVVGIFILSRMKILPLYEIFKSEKFSENEQNSRQEYNSKLALLAASGFWLLTALSPRAVEYAVPLNIFLCVFFLSRCRKKILIPLLAILSLVLQVSPSLGLYQHPMLPQRSLTPAALEAMSAVPPEAAGHKIYNCDWSLGPYILYKRPDMRFVDLLDPTFLAMKSSAKLTVRNQLAAGSFGDPHMVIKTAFRSDYVLCRDPVLVRAMSQSPYFNQLFPRPSARLSEPPSVWLFSMSEEGSKNFIHQFDAVQFPSHASNDLPNLKNLKKWELRVPNNSKASAIRTLANPNLPPLPSYFHLESFFYKDSARFKIPGAWNCLALRPTPEELREHIGATIVGVGGGGDIKIWLNGKEFYWTGKATPAQPNLLNNLIRLPRPLSKTDRLESVVCSPVVGGFHGFALSFWTRASLDQICGSRGYSTPKESTRTAAWPHSGVSEASCLSYFATRGEK